MIALADVCMDELKRLLKALYANASDVDKQWLLGGHEQRMQALRAQLIELEKHSSPVLQGLAKLAKKMPAEISQRQFLSILVPIERACSVTVDDTGLNITSEDQMAARADKNPFVFILDQIRSAFNVGAMIRTADCLNVEKVYLCGYTATPEHVKTKKSCMGSDLFVDWQWRKTSAEAISEVKSLGYRVLALETVAGGRDIVREPCSGKVAIVCGNERYGLDAKTVTLCDEIVQIPVFGHKNSLNVATAVAVAAYSCLGGR